MSDWDNKNTVFITVIKGFFRKTTEDKGIRVFSPYYGDDLPLRIFREICFRLPLLPKTIWYRKDVLKTQPKYITIIDVNITKHYLNWIKDYFPKAQINFLYDNMVGRARNICPDDVPDGIRIWTYDNYDSRKYNIRLLKNYWVRDELYKPKCDPEYDVFFVGRDKGRGKALLELEDKLHGMGLKTKFIITKDKKLSANRPYYQKPISYGEVIDYDTISKAILNITMENQEGVTMRDMEALVIGIKLITTNKNIVNSDLYDRRNVFILGVDDFNGLPDFINGESVDVWSKIQENHRFESMMNELTNED